MMDQKLTIGVFMLGCVIILAAILAYLRIERLEDIIHKQQDTIEEQQQAIMMQQVENQLLKRLIYQPN